NFATEPTETSIFCYDFRIFVWQDITISLSEFLINQIYYELRFMQFLFKGFFNKIKLDKIMP
ncbi:hypothetical protein, partial [Bacillus wiedmannii]|uniref:hypothetical protein n=1 Tax=Bacillus wiedmannii TaxID=1890302 RepID=UPI000BFAE8C3